MIGRYIAAAVGGTVITLAMLLAMNQVALKFKDRDPTRYFGIVDFVALPEGSRRPQPPPAPTQPPARPQIDIQRSGGGNLPVSMPRVDEDRVAPPPLIPEPDPNAVGPASQRQR
jgi:hypothetical protein